MSSTKKSKIPFQRIANYYLSYFKPNTYGWSEAIYSLSNTIMSNRKTSAIPAYKLFSRMEDNRTSQLELITPETVGEIINIINTNHPELFYKKNGEFSGGTYFDDLLVRPSMKNEKLKLPITNLLYTAKADSTKYDLAYLLNETTRFRRALIDTRTTCGYYANPSPHIDDLLIEKALLYFSETKQLEKKARLAERTKKYEDATRAFIGINEPRAAGLCAWLGGNIEQALDIWITTEEKDEKHRTITQNWIKNALMDSQTADKYKEWSKPINIEDLSQKAYAVLESEGFEVIQMADWKKPKDAHLILEKPTEDYQYGFQLVFKPEWFGSGYEWKPTKKTNLMVHAYSDNIFVERKDRNMLIENPPIREIILYHKKDSSSA
ncbi:hypothetical protein K9L97_05560 [Candidatus Woesearchaeota archaeon]|nr:hypothetical protein [Candidatus Woesearchaeota archaeon]